MVIFNHIVVKNGKPLHYPSISTFTVILVSDIIPSKKRIALIMFNSIIGKNIFNYRINV